MNLKLIYPTAISSILLVCLTPGVFSQSKVEKVEDKENSPKTVKMVTFLGVETSRVSNALRNHVDIPEGVGLTIEHVVEGTGAEEAGIQQYDILLEMDGQLIINQEQLRTLVRSKKPDDTVKVEIFRKGKKLKIDVELGEREAAQNRRFGRNLRIPMPPSLKSLGDWEDFDFNMEEFQEHMEKLKEKAADMGDEALQYIPEIMIERENENGSHQFTTFGKGQKRIRLTKGGVSATMEIVDGKKHFYITDKDDQVLYDGKNPDKEGVEKLPENVRAIIKELNSRKSFNWKSLKDIGDDKIRVIIDTGEEEAKRRNVGEGVKP